MSNQIVIANGSRGYSKFLDSPEYFALQYFGFKMGGSTRIRNCKITLKDNNEVFEFGINTNWDIIRYFPAHDIIIDSNGIGRSGSGNFGNGWVADVCGFYLNIPPEKLLNETEITVDYEYTSSNNKHGVGFWNQVDFVSNFSNENWIGTWDNVTYAHLPSNEAPLAKTTLISQSAVSFGTFYSRRLVIKSKPTIIDTKLSAFYRMSDLTDSSSNSRTLTPIGTITFSEGKIGNAGNFTGSNRASISIPGFATDFSYSCWVKRTGGSNDALIVGVTDAPSLSFRSTRIGGYTGSAAFETTTVYSLDTWYHLVLTNDRNAFTVYVNGVIGYQQLRVTSMTGTKTFLIGGESSLMFTGQIDAVGVWQRALVANEVTQLYNEGNGFEI